MCCNFRCVVPIIYKVLNMENDLLDKLFAEAGAAINRRWEQAAFAWEAFPQIAEEALQDGSPLVRVATDDLYRWVMTTSHLPKQHDLKASFAQPPVTVYSDDRFHIAFLFWTTSTTAIHQHSFEGAFRVFLGSSIQATYGFTEERRWGDHLLAGRLAMQSLEVLPTGRTCAIKYGSCYIHSAYHLDHPSITLIVRTHGRREAPQPQYGYQPPGLAVDPFYRPEQLERTRQVLSHLHQIADPEFTTYANEALDATDAFGAYSLLNHLRGTLPPAELPPMIDRLGERFGSKFSDLLPVVFREKDRSDRLIHARKTMTDPEGRFFLALLLNTSDADHFRSLLSERFPESKPQEVISRWVTALLKTNSLDIEPLSFSGMLVRGLLSGLPMEEVLRKLAPILRADAAMQTVRTHAEELVYLFRPVFDSAGASGPDPGSAGPSLRTGQDPEEKEVDVPAMQHQAVA